MKKDIMKPFVYSLFSFLIVLAFGKNILVSIICFLICFVFSYLLFKILEQADLPADKLERIELQIEKTKEDELKELAVSCKKEISKIKGFRGNISDEEMIKCIDDIYDTSNKILDNMTISHLNSMNNFFDYYIPETQKVLEKYVSLKDVIDTGTENSELSKKLLVLLEDISGSLKKILQGMFKDDLYGIETDIEILKNTLKSEGLSNDYDNI